MHLAPQLGTARVHRLPAGGAVLLALLASGCGINPVTGERELQLISTGEEITIGEQQYLPSRQMQGGEYVTEPAVSDYVSRVGQRLAAVADRELPYEFTVLNNSVPNAWALPGGKIAVNRGLLTELDSEAELGAVLGHEIVHAAARHGAKSVERGMLLQGALLGLAVSAHDNQYANLIVGGAMLGANLITTKYGRDAEREADRYGMIYMDRAGYNPHAAVDLQQTFVRLSEGREQGWLDGLFASHPPSQERVERNRQTAAELGDEGEYGREAYAAALAGLREAAPAYEAYDEGVKALREENYDRARQLARQAIDREPREAKFYELLGDAALAQENYRGALTHYEQSLERNSGYFKPYLQSGLAHYQLGETAAARRNLERSLALLPTANAHYVLGRIAETEGNRLAAIEHYQAAAGSQSDVGQRSAAALVRLDLPVHPSQYLRVRPQLGNDGRVYLIVENPTPVTVRDVRIAAAVVDATGRPVHQPLTLRVAELPAGRAVGIASGLGTLSSPAQLATVRAEVVAARVAE